ncbi:MAG: MFS transporter [Parvibaculum sp.]|nr:MFS transporter [Parvibaculum sp.]|tara:strand:- start:49610 stop:50839 length:1230 start_codon:yes stop_codon:yes gene_type:complete
MSEAVAGEQAQRNDGPKTAVIILAGLSFCHLLNDMIQSLLPAIYPLLKANYALSFTQIGLITFAFQMTASIFQPVIGYATDKRSQPYSLTIGMGFTLVGLLLLAVAHNFAVILLAAMLIGTGSSVFHPESSRIARFASGGRHGLAQSVFQVGGNTGSAIGPLLAAFIVIQRGQASIAWFALAAALGMMLLWNVGGWYKRHMAEAAKKPVVATPHHGLSQRRVVVTIGLLMALIFSKFFYQASLSSYYTFYLIDKFHVSVETSQLLLFVYLFATAAGTLIGGPIGDKIGRRYVIWGSILGVLPFTLILPHVNLFWTAVLTVPIGLIIASAFSAIIVYAQDLMPGRVGTVAGLFFGFAFGMGGIGAASLGVLADHTSIGFVYNVCAFLPAIGLLALLLPNLDALGASVAAK